MKLIALLKSLPITLDTSDLPDLGITGIQEDSRKVQPGDLFIARGGTTTDGAKYLEHARGKGALAALVAEPVASCPLPQIRIADPAAAISPLADAFYGHPSRQLKVIGITGTNGKTTTTCLIQQILHHHAIKCGLIGTVLIDDGRTRAASNMTTPSPIDVFALLARMRDNGCCACAIEVSSQGLDQHRVGAVQFAAGAFTNLTGDHLDYHKTMDNYAAAKARLFEMLPADAAAIVNARDSWSPRIARKTPARARTFGVELPSDYQASGITVSSDGSRFTLRTPAGSVPMHMQLIGRHNIENALTAAACVAEVFGLTPQQIADGLANAPGAPGRLQRVSAGQKFDVFVDYAHTDDGLENVLSALRPITTGRLRVLFGCGGDRDPSKRPRMGKVAQRLADAIYITSDNPRTEAPDKIISAIIAGLDPACLKPLCVEPDRRQAIASILHDAQDNDIVLLAGKGHEDYQIIGTTKHHFDDVEEATRCLQTR
jgi:UDP-N-acetylmuramoyl-L-alanyl-D-glutamate--2,6-diaminopimelate ligase